MNWAALLFSSSGAIKPGPFGLAIAFVYVGSILSLALPTSTRPALGALFLFQVLLTWCWYSLHAKRLADAGRRSTVAIIIAIFYLIAVSFSLYLAYETLSIAPVQPQTPGATPVDTPPNSIAAIVVILLFTYMFNTGNFGIIVWFLALILLVPLVLGLLVIFYSIVVGVRPSVALSDPHTFAQ